MRDNTHSIMKDGDEHRDAGEEKVSYTADSCLPKPQANSLTQGQRNNPHPAAPLWQSTPQPHSLRGHRRIFNSHLRLPKDHFPINHCTGLNLTCLASSLRSPPPHSLSHLGLSGSTTGSSLARRAEVPARRCRKPPVSDLQEGWPSDLPLCCWRFPEETCGIYLGRCIWKLPPCRRRKTRW